MSGLRTEYTHLCGICREEHARPAFRTATPGLVVAQGWWVHNPDYSDAWYIVHHPTGLGIHYLFPDPETVQAAARDLAPLADWTEVDPDCDKTEVFAALRAAGGTELLYGRSGERVQRNEVVT